MKTKIVIVLRDSFDAAFICSQVFEKLAGQHFELGVILESGKMAKQKKLLRYFKGKSFLKKLIAVLNIAFLLAFHKVMTMRMRASIGDRSIPPQLQILGRVDDVNELSLCSLVKQFNPDVMFNFGTALYKQDTLTLLNRDIFNIHTSILPFYRNVHSDFWAYLRDDFSRIGVSIFRIDAGIDTGQVVMQRHLEGASALSLSEIKVGNLHLICSMILEFCNRRNELSFVRGEQQDKNKGSIFHSPSAMDILRFLMKRWRTSR